MNRVANTPQVSTLPVVWIVSEGEVREGSRVRSLHSSLDGAARAAAALRAEQGGEWCLRHQGPARWLWEQGCDRVAIEAHGLLD